MIVASLEKDRNTKIAYRCFTNKLNDQLKAMHNRLDDTKAEISVYKSLYGDMDESFMLPNTKIYTDISTFRDAVLNETPKEKVLAIYRILRTRL